MQAGAAEASGRPGPGGSGNANPCAAVAAPREYPPGVNHVFHPDDLRHPVSMRWFVSLAWVVILAKCVLVWWAIDHWNVPVHPAWIIGPTLGMAALATILWLGHVED